MLLRSNIDGPPDRVRNLEIFVSNSVNDSRTTISRVCLDIDSLYGVLHDNISEGNVLDTIVVTARVNGTNGHANTKVNSTVMH